MRRIQPLSLILVVALVACDGDAGTGPLINQPAAIARHIDSLMLAALDSSSISANYEPRQLILQYAEVAPAYGATPTQIAVETGAGTEHWFASEYEIVSSTEGVLSEPYIVIVAYRDLSFTTAFVAYLAPDGDTTYSAAALLTGDTILVQASPTKRSAALTGLGATCQLASGLSDSYLLVQVLLGCHLASFTGSVTVTFPAAPGVDPSLLNFSIPSQTMWGEQFITPPPV
jgi:hypothetical protein